jgi:hypothetical protein
MRLLAALIIVGPLMLFGAAAAADPSIQTDRSAQPAAGTEPAADRDSYTRRARDEMQAWQQKLHDFGVEAEAAGRKDTIAAEHDLSEAWAQAAADMSKLQAASAADWDSAKVSYETASRKLADTWDRTTRPNK